MTDPNSPQLVPGIDLDPYAWTTPATTDAVREALAAAWSPVPCCDCPGQVHHADGRCALCPCRGNQQTSTESEH